jgi:hypothetical protein
MARLKGDEDRKDAFTLRPPAKIVAAVKWLADEDGIATERAMGASCLRAGVALRALISAGRAGLSDDEIEVILMPFVVPLVRFLQGRGLLAAIPSPAVPTDHQQPGEAAGDDHGLDENLDAMRHAADDLANFMEM